MKRPGIKEIVVGVFAVLLALGAVLLLSALGRAREQARRTSCLGNLKQLGLAMKQYAEDFDDRYPWNAGRTNPEEAWRDLGLLYPGYTSGPSNYICPSSREEGSRSARRMVEEASRPSPPKPPDPIEANRRPRFRLFRRPPPSPPYRGQPFESTGSREVISYAYGIDARGGVLGGKHYAYLPWTGNAKSTVQLLADKKAGVVLTKRSNHKLGGRNVLYNDGHVKWKPDTGAVDPNADDDAIGAPGAKDYRAWWSDPPYYGE